jgi:hypothetical protein
MKLKLSTFILGTSLLLTPLLAAAHDFTIDNNTKQDITFKIDHVCSHEIGIINPFKATIVPDKNLKRACANNLQACVAEAYHSSNCTGKQLGAVVLDIDNGVKDVSAVAEGFAFSWSYFYLNIADALSQN